MTSTRTRMKRTKVTQKAVCYARSYRSARTKRRQSRNWYQWTGLMNFTLLAWGGSLAKSSPNQPLARWWTSLEMRAVASSSLAGWKSPSTLSINSLLHFRFRAIKGWSGRTATCPRMLVNCDLKRLQQLLDWYGLFVASFLKLTIFGFQQGLESILLHLGYTHPCKAVWYGSHPTRTVRWSKASKCFTIRRPIRMANDLCRPLQ